MVVVRDLGYALLYVGFGVAVAAMVFSVPIATRSLWRLRPIGALQVLVPSPPSATASIGGAMPVGLLLPAVHGTALDGSEITLIGFSGLDPISVAMIITGSVVAWLVALTAAAAAGYGRGLPDELATTSMRAGATTLAACVTAIILGNALVQLTVPGGSRAAWGLWLYSFVGLVWVALAGLEWRSASTGKVGSRRRDSPPRFRPRHF